MATNMDNVTLLKQQVQSWLVINQNYQMENVGYLTHCTSADNKESIKEDNVLKKRRTPCIWNLPLARPDAPEGVWFGVTLWNSDLPTMSPFGTERVLKPLTSLQNHSVLYLEAIHPHNGIMSVRLILLKDDDLQSISWCYQQGLKKLDINDNPFLTKNDSMGLMPFRGWKTFRNTNWFPIAVPDTWVYVFIADDVDIEDCEWDTVQLYQYCSNCNSVGHSNPECPKTQCFKCGYFGHWASKCPL